MRIVHADLEMWSDNKTAWWWEGVLVSNDHETYGGVIDLFPGPIAPEGGLYTLAIQNSNDFWQTANPMGTAFELCVTWAHSDMGYRYQLPLVLKAVVR